MVEKVAPWLTVDSDPYPAVIDGKIQWILDGYTVTDRFPLSQRESLETMTDDSLTQTPGFQTLPTDEINYMRNAVKATVDAYDGTVTLYAWDEEDPILKAWSEVFPGVVQPKAEIPDALMEHLRYPDDLFKVQRYQFARYHVTDAKDWYEDNNRWEVPKDPQAENQLQPPYRLFTDGVDGEANYSLTSVYVPVQEAEPRVLRERRQRRDQRYLRQDLRARAAQRAHRRAGTGRQRDQLGRGRPRGGVLVQPGQRDPGLRQPADAAGGRRVDVRPAVVREAFGHRVELPDPAVRARVLRRRVGIGTTLREAIADVLGVSATEPDARARARAGPG